MPGHVRAWGGGALCLHARWSPPDGGARFCSQQRDQLCSMSSWPALGSLAAAGRPIQQVTTPRALFLAQPRSDLHHDIAGKDELSRAILSTHAP